MKSNYRDISMELEFKEPLTYSEKDFLNQQCKQWDIVKKDDGLYHLWFPTDSPLFDVAISIEEDRPDLLKKISKCNILNCDNGENYNLYESWKEDGII